MDFNRLLVATKFAPPHIGARFISRKTLLDQLHEGEGCNFVLVTGGAGFGKTVLLAQWRRSLMEAGNEVSWLSLSNDERHLSSFVAYFAAALGRLGIQIEGEMVLSGDDDVIAQSLEAMVAAAVNAATAIPKDLYLIVDDYHYVDDPRSHRLVQKLIDYCPANLHIVIASRVAPPLSVSRLRVLGRMSEIGFGELPFDMEESRSFLGQNLGKIRLTDAEMQLIHEKTGGWPASLELMAIMLRSRPESRARLRDLAWSSTDLQPYLAEEVMANLPTDMVDVMEQVSVCRRFNAELATAITGSAQTATLLQRVEDENLLVYRAESEDRLPWYRFHPLFREFLSARLARRTDAHLEELHRRASQWFKAHGLLLEAVRHAIQGGELTFAAEAIDQAEKDGWSLSYLSLMLRLLDRLPQETLFAHPRLFFLSCLTLSITNSHPKAARWLSQIRESQAAQNPAISSRLPLVDAALAMQHDDPQRCIDLLEPLHRVVVSTPYQLHVYLSLLGSAYAFVGRYADAHRLFDANPINPLERKNDIALVADSSRVLVLVTEGDVRTAAEIGGEMLGVMESLHGRTSVCAIVTAATVSEAYYELNRMDDARKVLANRGHAVMSASMPPVMLAAALVTSRLEGVNGSPESVLAFLETQARHYHGLGLPRLRVHMLAEQVRVLIGMGEKARAGQVVARIEEIAQVGHKADAVGGEIRALLALAQARLVLANSRPYEALEALAVLHTYASGYGRAQWLVRERLLVAVALYELKRLEEMQDRLIEVVTIAAHHGLVRTVLDEGPSALALLEQVKGDPRLHAAASAHLEAWLAHLDKKGVAQVAARPRVDASGIDRVSLTPRELEILGLVAQAMSNKRIALTLNISVDTVKWNVRNILTKLGLSSRYDAMNWARKQGLIE